MQSFHMTVTCEKCQSHHYYGCYCSYRYVTAESQELVASRNELPFLEATKAALRQAVQSYAPYSHCPSGLAIVTAGGAIYSGPYLESAAFNPSLGPLQAAVIDAVIDGIAYYTEVGGVSLCLCEQMSVHVVHLFTSCLCMALDLYHTQITPESYCCCVLVQLCKALPWQLR